MTGEHGSPQPGWWIDDHGEWHPPRSAEEADAAAAKEQTVSTGVGCLVLLLVGAVLWWAGSSMGSSDGNDTDAKGTAAAPQAREETSTTVDPETIRYGAFDVCTEFVKDRLKAPSTAKFRNYFEDDGEVVVTGGPTEFVVTSTVDSENSFSASLRSTFVCTVSHAGGGRWQLVDLQIE